MKASSPREVGVTRAISASDRARIFDIWNSVYPTQIHFRTLADLEAYLDKAVDPMHFVWRFEDAKLGGWLMTFLRDGQRNFVLLVAGAVHGRGVGSALIEKMKSVEPEIVGWAVASNDYVRADLKPYRSPLRFYEKHGFTVDRDTFQKDAMSAVRIAWRRGEAGAP